MMDKQQIIKIGIIGLALIVVVNLVVVLGYILLTRAAPNALDAPLNPNGEAYEINPDDTGRLWISDYKASEVWGVDPVSGAYAVYPVSASPVDARQAGGWLWWAAGVSNILGRVSTSDGSFSEWQVSDAPGFLSTNLDDLGRLYATDSSNPYLYRLDPDPQNTNLAELCTFTLPGFGAGNYIVRNGDNMWVDNIVDSILMRLQISNDQLTRWSLPEGSSPFGMAVDEQGNLWYADSGTNTIARFDPNANQLTSYTLPDGNQPEMVAVQSDTVWYTEPDQPIFGRLDSLTANHTILPLTPETQQLTSDCVDISPSNTGSVSVKAGQLNWSDNTYRTKLDQDGLLSFQMPDNSKPQGIALDDSLYVVDRGRQVLIHFLLTQEVTPANAPPSTPTYNKTPVFIPTITLSADHFRTYLPLILRDNSSAP
jgi:streptogramin lyase